MNDTQEYKGELGEDGLPYGEGVFTESNGDECKGTFKNLPHGFIFQTFKNGSIVMGERKSGQLHGRMTYYRVTSDKSLVFNEVWRNNKKITSDQVDKENPEQAWFGNG